MLSSTSVVVFVILSYFKATATVPIIVKTNVLAEGFHFLIENVFEGKCSSLMIHFEENESGLVQRISRKVFSSKLPIVIVNPQAREVAINVDIFCGIFIANTLKSFKCIDEKKFHKNGHYVVVLDSEISMESIFKKFWSAFVFNVNVLIPSENYSKASLFTFSPFNGKTCGNTLPVEINKFDMTTKLWSSDVYFPKSSRIYIIVHCGSELMRMHQP